ncbi:MAG: type II toxin-antitoxin system VapC family toxin [Alphaproteobacteria bacterium]|nr:type II toxin-antitoxin system VapC family toxin [Alphaproteobacteria bacterium]
MVVDASAFLAILRGEPEEESFKLAIALAPVRHMSPVNWFEVAVNSQKGGDSELEAVERLGTLIGLVIVPIDAIQLRLAFEAWRRFGKGRHRARLNLGDCFAYALAKSLDAPLLYKGGDFAHTDVVSAV